MEPSLVAPELVSDSKFSLKACARTTDHFFAQVCKRLSASEMILRLNDYADRLQEEIRKIDGLEVELPLTKTLLSNAVVAVKEEMDKFMKSNEEPVLKHFMPLKRSCGDDDDESVRERDIGHRDKKGRMSSVQLWNPKDEPHSPNIDLNSNGLTLKLNNYKERVEEETKWLSDNQYQSGNNGGIRPSKGRRTYPVMIGKEATDGLLVQDLSFRTPEIKNSRVGINYIGSQSNFSRSRSSSVSNLQSSFKTGQQQTGRKRRRCWSPELHQRFIQALEKLGGHQTATPKLIRELMQVESLTNDEVKSHLQKFRLHARRTAAHASIPHCPGLWMPQERCGGSLKQCNSQSSSSESPLQSDERNGVDEDEVDQEPESHYPKSLIALSG